MKSGTISTLIMALLALSFTGCATYQYAKNVKMLSYDENVAKGKSLGPVLGEDCTWTILGYKLGGYPKLERAFASARNQTSSGITDGFHSQRKVSTSDSAVRYMNNVSTEYDGFNAGIVAKNCLIVKGTGYR